MAVFLIYQNVRHQNSESPVRFQTFYLGDFFSVSSYSKISETTFEIIGQMYIKGDCALFKICKLTIDVTDVINNEIALVKLGREEYRSLRSLSRPTNEIDGYNSHISIRVEVTGSMWDHGE